MIRRCRRTTGRRWSGETASGGIVYSGALSACNSIWSDQDDQAEGGGHGVCAAGSDQRGQEVAAENGTRATRTEPPFGGNCDEVTARSGLKEVTVEIDSYRPATGRFQKRPDISERLQFAHEYARPESVESVAGAEGCGAASAQRSATPTTKTCRW